MDELCTSAEPAQMKDVYKSAMNSIFYPKTSAKKATPTGKSKASKVSGVVCKS